MAVVLLSVVALHYIAVEALLYTEAQQVLSVTVNRKTFLSNLTLSLLMSYIYGAPCKARNFNVSYMWTYVWQC
jgi:hypothetical protein